MRTLILLLIYIIIVLLLIPVLLVCMLIRAPQPILVVGKWAMKLGKAVLGINLEVSGLETIDKKSSYVFMANHLSFLDGPLLYMLIPQPVRVILKKEVFRIPIVGLGMSHVDFIPVDRKRIIGGKRSIEKASRLMRERGFSFLIFPEGTRSRDGNLQPFKRGGFFLALASQAPILPISIKGSFELMPKGSFFVKRGKIKVVFNAPVPVLGFNRDNLYQLIERVRSIIQTKLD